MRPDSVEAMVEVDLLMNSLGTGCYYRPRQRNEGSFHRHTPLVAIAIQQTDHLHFRQ